METPEHAWHLSQRHALQGSAFAPGGADAVAWDAFGDGPPVVMVHGTPFSSFVWRRIAAEVARSHRVYLFDLLGYGRSSQHQGQDVSLCVQNAVLAELLQAWALPEPPVVLAHDFGGATALRAHLLDGCEYAGLLLMDAVALRPWGSALVQHARAHGDALAGLPAYLHEALLTTYVQSAACQPLSEAALAGYRQPWLGEAGAAAFYRQIAQMDMAYTDAIADRLQEVRCPARVLWGEADGWLPVEQGRRLAEALGAPLQTVPQAGHLVQEDAPEAVLAELARLLNGLGRSI